MLKKGFLARLSSKEDPFSKKDDCTGSNSILKFSSAEKGKSIDCSKPHHFGISSSIKSPTSEDLTDDMDPLIFL